MGLVLAELSAVPAHEHKGDAPQNHWSLFMVEICMAVQYDVDAAFTALGMIRIFVSPVAAISG